MSLSVSRSYSADAINAVVNHPEVRPHVGAPGGGYLDLSSEVANHSNVLLMGEGGGVILHQQELGVYELHTNFLPEHRGAATYKAMSDAFYWMFTRTPCVEILTKCPKSNPGTAAMARRLGFVLDFERENAWAEASGEHTPIEYFALRYPDWVRKAPLLPEIGSWFHDHLESEKKRLGILLPGHADDAAHDRHVGSAMAMIFGGQIPKGVALYNRWAAFSGYRPVSIVHMRPPLIDMGDCLLHIKHETLEVIPCQSEWG